MNSKNILVCGAGGFIGTHLVELLRREGFWVHGVDLKYPEFSTTDADDFIISDLRDQSLCNKIFYSFSECIYPAYNQTDPENPNGSTRKKIKQ